MEHREPSEIEAKNCAIAFAYDNYPELKQHNVKINARDCGARRIRLHQRVVGPGEAIDIDLSDEVWEVIIPLEVFSGRLIVPVRRNSDGSLEVTDDPQFLQ